MPPPMTWRAVGAMVGPDGGHVVWLSRGADEVAITPNMQLDDGYVVQSIGDDEVVLVYPSLGTTAHIPLPRGPVERR